MKYIIFTFFSLILFSCSEDYNIKPIGQLRLEYPEPQYRIFDSDCAYSFEYSDFSKIEKRKEDCWYSINYPEMKANIFLTYFPIADKEDLGNKIKDSERFVQEQTVKASYIAPQEFHFPEKRVFGTLYELGGESAINLQFHATDSTHNLLSGSIYFSTPPRYDSLRPAIQYIKEDLVHLIETLEWN